MAVVNQKKQRTSLSKFFQRHHNNKTKKTTSTNEEDDQHSHVSNLSGLSGLSGLSSLLERQDSASSTIDVHSHSAATTTTTASIQHQQHRQPSSSSCATTTTTSQPSKHARVRFEDAARVIVYHSDCLEVPDEELWYSKKDYGRFQQAHMLLAKGLSRSRSELSSAFRAAYQQACKQSRSKDTSVVAIQEDVLVRVQQILEQQQAQTAQGDCCVGLEYAMILQSTGSSSGGGGIGSVTKFAEDRRAQLHRAICSKKYRSNHRKSYYTPQEQQERLAKACQRVTRPARQFATLTAHAHAQEELLLLQQQQQQQQRPPQ